MIIFIEIKYENLNKIYFCIKNNIYALKKINKIYNKIV